MNRRYDVLINLIHSLLQVVLTVAILGAFYGWLDDLYPSFNLSGRVISTPTADFNLAFHTHLGYIYLWLYKVMPTVNWFGYIMYGFVFLIVLCVNFVLLRLSRTVFSNPWPWFLFLSYGVFGALLTENVFLLNYTRIAILLCLFSLLAIMIILRDGPSETAYRWQLVGFALLFLFGFSIRFSVVAPVLILAVLFSFMYLRSRVALAFTSILFAASVGFIGVSWLLQGKQNQQEILQDIQLIRILDGMDGPMPHEFTTPHDSIKSLALYFWFIADRDSLLNQGYLNSFTRAADSVDNSFSKWIGNLMEEVAKARGFYSDEYLGALNWLWKSVVLFLMALCLPLAFYWANKCRIRYLWMALMLAGLSAGLILLIALFFKMEDRVLNPVLIFLCLSMLVFMTHTAQGDLRRLYVGYMLFLVALTGIRVPAYLEISAQRKSDLLVKSTIRDEMEDLFPDKTVLLDLYSSLLLETSPFSMQYFPDNWITCPEVWNFNIAAHQQRLEQIVGCTDWPCFFQRIAERPDDFVFVWLSDRVKIAEDYNRLVYGYDLKFHRDTTHSAIDDLEYSFLWMPLDLDYFTLKPAQRDSL